MTFRGVFIAVVLGTALVVVAMLVHRARPRGEVERQSVALVRATGKCAECHRQETSAVVHEYEMSRHASANVNCLDCHQPTGNQEVLDHRGFRIAKRLTAANCRQCHATEYEQYLRSRHAAPSWAAVHGPDDFTAEQVSFAEQFHKGAVDRRAHPLVAHIGAAGVSRGCVACHDIGKPNADGSIGSCTKCHARHVASVELARTPQTCGQCHMGPDHSQIEIYNESKHGVLFHAQRDRMNLAAPPKRLTTADMPVPTCATCHMSGLEGQRVTHDTTERLSYFLFAETSQRRPTALQGQLAMKETCLKCHTTPRIDQFYAEAEAVVDSTNAMVQRASALMAELRAGGLLTPEPFDEPIEFVYFDLWHYFGRTAKHGAFMGGADFVQWHGYYELVNKTAEIRRMAEELRAGRARTTAQERGPDGDANPRAFPTGG
jgi:hydroxylamine dehydrogenase